MLKEDKPKKKYDICASDIKNEDVPSRYGLIKENYVVKQPIARLDKSITRVGRKRTYTPTRMRNEVNRYLSWVEENDRVPSIKGLMIHLKMHKTQFYTYCEYPEFENIMEQARLVIAEWCENDVYRTPGAASSKIAYMKNLHGWTEKIEETSNKTISIDDARSKLELLLPQLMAKIKQASITQTLEIDKVQEAVIESESL